MLMGPIQGRLPDLVSVVLQTDDGVGCLSESKELRGSFKGGYRDILRTIWGYPGSFYTFGGPLKGVEGSFERGLRLV